MKTYRCLRCDKLFESEKAVLCPECGFLAPETPYDRRETLISETKKLLDELKFHRDALSLYNFYRNKGQKEVISLADDRSRFPDFEKVYQFLRSAPKTEIFFERLGTTLTQLRKHFHTPFRETYIADDEYLIEKISSQDTVFQNACTGLGLRVDLKEIEFDRFWLDYAEIPGSELSASADQLLDALEELGKKINTFIKKSSIYDTVYKKFHYRSPQDQTKLTLDAALAGVEKVLKKRIILDIFSDGTDEVTEMLKPLWFAFDVLLSVPVLDTQYVYRDANGKARSQEDFRALLADTIRKHYSEPAEPASLKEYLNTKSEDWLFDHLERLFEAQISGWDDFSENPAAGTESEQLLNNLVGLQSVKQSIRKIKAYALANKDSEELNLHMCFLGNPGTGKTEAARIIAGILFENGILPSGNVVEVDRSDLIAGYVGQTALKTEEKIEEAMGGVLFIDEAYALIPKDGSYDFGHEAIATLIKAMEDYRGKFCVILAGYRNEMKEMLSSNPGFQSRIQFTLDFPNYDRDELKLIAQRMLTKREYEIADPALEKMLDITDVMRKDPNFANAREVRNLLDQVIMCQNLRTADAKNKMIELTDVNRYIKDSGIHLPVNDQEKVKKILTGEEELEQLIGLASVKRMIRKIKAYAKKNAGSEGFNLHMVFYGNPGTGKTEVARILSRILYDAGVLSGSKLVETDGLGLLGKSVGETAPKTLEKINEAMNGVLFIDEAYALNGSGKGTLNYGDEAIAVLLKEMEDRRGQFCVILAGYKKAMEAMLSANPGFESRIQFTLEFPDFTREEFGEIAQRFLSKKKYEITPDALDLVLDIMEYYRKEPNFANARTLRNLLDQVIMNQNLRTEDDPDDNMINKSDVEDYLTDEKIDLSKQNRGSRHMGFI